MSSNRDPIAPSLSELIRQADESVTEASARLSSNPKLRRAFLGRRIVIVTLLAALGFFGYTVWRHAAPPPKSSIADDLEYAVDLAKTAIDAAKSRTGELPAAIPNASIASVVRYENDAQGYKLSATMMGVRVTLERDGSKTRDTSLPK